MRYLLPPTAGAEMKGIPGLLHFDEQLALPSTVYLFDCGGMNQLEPPRCAAITIVVSSPDPSHYGDWVKAKPVFTMPVWSAEECAAVVPAIYPARPLPDGTDESAARFKLHGGIARTIFSQETSATLQAQLEEAITACNLPAVVGSIDLSQKLPGATHRLLHYAVDETNYRSRTLIFATDDICERVMEKQEKEHSNDVVSFLIGAAGRKDIAGVRGKVFELHAHAVLPLGGEFKARWEDDEKHEELWMQFNASNRKGVVKDLSVLADRVSRSCHPSHSLNWQCRKCSRIITRGAHMTLTCVRVRVCVMFQEYARLLKPNYPVIDAALRPKHLFPDDRLRDALHQCEMAPSDSYRTRPGADTLHSVCCRALGHLSNIPKPVHFAIWRVVAGRRAGHGDGAASEAARSASKAARSAANCICRSRSRHDHWWQAQGHPHPSRGECSSRSSLLSHLCVPVVRPALLCRHCRLAGEEARDHCLPVRLWLRQSTL